MSKISIIIFSIVLFFSNLNARPLGLRRALFSSAKESKSAKTNCSNMIDAFKNKEITRAKLLIKENYDLGCSILSVSEDLDFIDFYLELLKNLIIDNPNVISDENLINNFLNIAAKRKNFNFIENILNQKLDFKNRFLSKLIDEGVNVLFEWDWIIELIKAQRLPENYEYCVLFKAIKRDEPLTISLILDSYKDKIYPCKFFWDKNKNLLHLAVEYGDNSMFDKLLATGQVGLSNIDIKDKENNRSALESAKFLSRQPVINQEDYQDLVNKINNYKRLLNFVVRRSAGNIPPEIAQKIVSYCYNIQF